jgi:hypothetical protein
VVQGKRHDYDEEVVWCRARGTMDKSGRYKHERVGSPTALVNQNAGRWALVTHHLSLRSFLFPSPLSPPTLRLFSLIFFSLTISRFSHA